MSAQQATDGAQPVVVSPRREDDEHLRELAVKQIERKRRFHRRAFSAAAVAVVLVIIWAITEYNNAGGWPTDGFSQSSGIPHEWNSWIIYPIIALALAVAIDAWHTYGGTPITEGEIRREMNRQRGAQ
ncbi:MAG TPA: 2TM domain-containing protein [Solirubrobacteraceae bacterium]|nr:2TM domain-containing protein [Solirubrobacteraceae bacterium]